MRVLFLSDHLGHPEGRVHGATTYFLHILPELTPPDVELTACFLRERHPAADELESRGVHPLFLGRSKWDPRALREIIRIIKNRHIDFVHAAGMKGIMLGRIAARITRRPVIIHLHDTNPLDPATRFIQRRCSRWTDLTLCISRAVADYATETLAIDPEKTKVLFNPLPIEKYESVGPAARERALREWRLPPDRDIVGLIGRFTEEKGQAELIRAFPKLLERSPGAHLLLVGDGPRRSSCETMAREMNLTGRVTFTGHRSDIPELLSICRVVVLPSHREGLGYTALEAMGTGKPVVAYAVGGLPEIVLDGETGFLIPPGNMDLFVERTADILNHSALAERLGTEGRKQARAFSIDSHVADLKNIYRAVCRAGERRS